MSKLLVETAGDFQIYGRGEDHHAHHDRPSVVRQTGLIQQRIASKDLIVLHELEDEATDAEFAGLYDPENPEKSVAEYFETYGIEPEERPLKAAKKPADPKDPKDPKTDPKDPKDPK